MSTAVANRPGTRAKIRYLRMSASKVRVVLDLIRNKSVTEALKILDLSERGTSRDVAKCLRSAIANAEHNDEIPADELFVSECYSDEGPTIKRFRPRARGRAGRIHKQTCHVTIVVSRYSTEEIDAQKASAQAKAASGSSGGTKKKKKAAPSRSARVAASKKDAEPTSEAKSETIDSDADGEVNAVDESPYGEGSHAVLEDGSMPEGFEIKGNASSKLYHVPGSAFYKRTNPEVWFASEEAAEAAGFLKPASQRDEEE